MARGLSNYLDQLMGNVMQESFQNLLHLHVSFLSPYIDFFAFAVSFLLSGEQASLKKILHSNELIRSLKLSFDLQLFWHLV